MTLCSSKTFKTFKPHYCQQHWLNFKKVMAPLTNNEKKKTSLLPVTFINRFEKSCGTFKRGGGKKPMLSMTLGQFAPKTKT